MNDSNVIELPKRLCEKHKLDFCKSCRDEDIDRLVKLAEEAAILRRESELRPMLDVGFTRAQAEWIADNLVTNLQTLLGANEG